MPGVGQLNSSVSSSDSLVLTLVLSDSSLVGQSESGTRDYTRVNSTLAELSTGVLTLMSELSTHPLGRNCENPQCGKPLFGKQPLSVKRFCNAKCRTIAWALRQEEKVSD